MCSLESTPLQSPCDRFFLAGKLRAQVARLGTNADATKVQTIRIPTAQHGDVTLRQAQLVIADRFMKECKICIAQLEDALAKGQTEFGSTFAVARIGAIVLPTAIVEKGEQFDD